MENASKALIIAGAILLSILLISLGIMIFNQAQSAVDGSGMSDAQVQTFNAKWLKYEGRQKGSTIRSLVQEVMANNNNDEASEETMVSINKNNKINTTTTINTGVTSNPVVTLEAGANKQPTYTSFSNTITYTVSFKYNNGRIAVIDINV